MKSFKIDKVRLNLVGLDGNVFMVIGAFAKAARRQGFADSEINVVLDEARSLDYDHLLGTIAECCDATEEA